MKFMGILFCILQLALVKVALSEGNSLDGLKWESYPEDQEWKTILSERNKKTWIIEKIPQSNKEGDLSDLMVAQAFGGQKKVTAEKFAKNMMKAAKKSCKGLRVNGPKVSKEYGYEIAHAQIYCGLRKKTDYGAETFFKVMKLDDSIYVVTREFRVPPTKTGGVVRFSKDEMAGMIKKMKAVKTANTANTYLVNNVYLCGPDIDDEKCDK